MSSSTRPPLHKSRAVQLTVGLVVTLACLAYAFYKMTAGEDPRAVFRRIGAAFAAADYRTLPLFWLVLALFYWIKAWRWRWMLAPLGDFRPTRDLLPPIMSGFAFNNLLPARLGELVRVFVFSRAHNVPKTPVLASVALERILDAVTILALLGVGLLIVPDMPDDIRRTATVGAAVAGAGVVCVLIYLIWTRHFVRIAEYLMNAVPILPEGLRRKIIGILDAGTLGLAALKTGRLLAFILLTSFAQWALNAVLVYLALAAFSIDLPWGVSLVLLAVIAFGVAAPSAPGYFGIIQLCFLIVLEPFIDDRERIFAASIYFHVAQYVPVTLVGLIYFNRMGLRMQDVEETAEATAQPPGAALAVATADEDR